MICMIIFSACPSVYPLIIVVRLSARSTFTPQLYLCVPPRRVTTDDLERDAVLSQRIALFGWIEEKHLDVPEGEGSKGFLEFAQQGIHSLPLAFSGSISMGSYVVNRNSQNQSLQSATRQTHLYPELLQSHFWFVSLMFPSCML